jgi:hypothetical protein
MTISVTALFTSMLSVKVSTRWKAARLSSMQARMPGYGEHQPGGRLGDIRCAGNRDAHLRLPQRRRVVGTVAAHADGVALALEGLDQVEFVLRQDAGIDGIVMRPCLLGDLAGRADRPVQAYGAGDGAGGLGRVAGDHDGRRCRAL